MIKSKILFLLMMVSTLLFTTIKVSAHGRVVSPASRAQQGVLAKITMGYAAAHEYYGEVINNANQLETYEGFPGSPRSPKDGKIASAGGQYGGILDQQTADKWVKTNVSTGVNNFIWEYSEPHKTRKWEYYMTKVGWNPNKPLTRSDLELIKTIKHDGSQATTVPHKVTIPADRKGYHIVLAVWETADTDMSFYNVIDLNVKSDETPTLPGTPVGLAQEFVTSSLAKIKWTAQGDATSYNVFRGTQLIKEVSSPIFEESGLTANTTYTYIVQAKNAAGVSAKSNPLSVKTLEESAVEKPTTPSGLHSMTVTENSVELMWSSSVHSEDIKNYQVFRGSVKVKDVIGTMFNDTGLAENTEYTYTIKAVANTGEVSYASKELKVRTKKVDADDGVYCGAEVYSSSKSYPTADTKVFFSCKIWKNKWYANPNESPGTSLVWEEIEACTDGPDCEDKGPVTHCGSEEYNSVIAYPNVGTKVYYDLKIWENQWYANPGEIPGKNSAWKMVSDCKEGQGSIASKNDLSVIIVNNVIDFMPETYYGKINEVNVYTTGSVKVLSVSKPAKNTINTSSLPSGVYFMNIIFTDGSTISKTIKK